MLKPRIEPDGKWSAVAALPGGEFAHVYSTNTHVVCKVNGAERWRANVGAMTMFLDAAASPDGTVAVVGKHAGSGVVVLVVDGLVSITSNPTRGNQPVAIRFADRGFEYAYVVGGDTYAIASNDGTKLYSLSVKGTSQGIRDFTPGGIKWGDQTLRTMVRDRFVYESRQRGPWVIGQLNHGFGVARIDADHSFHVMRCNIAYGVRAAMSGDRLGIAAYTEHGAVLVEVSPPYPPHEDIVVVPTPTPKPKPEENPVSASYIDVLKKWRAHYNHLAPGKVRGLLITNGAAWELRATGAGLLAKPQANSTVAYDGKNFPADILCFPNGDHFDALMDGDGKAEPTWQAKGKIRSDWKYVPPYDPDVIEDVLLGVTSTPAPQPRPEPVPEPPTTTVEPRPVHEIRDLLSETNQLLRTLIELWR